MSENAQHGLSMQPLPPSLPPQSRVSHPLGKNFLLFLVVVVLLFLVGGGAYYLGIQRNQSQKVAQTISTPTPTPAWQLYSYGNGYSLSYPTNWTARENIQGQGDVLFYANNSTTIVPTGSIRAFPDRYVYIFKPGTGETAKEYADRITSGPQYTGRQTFRKTIQIKDLTAEMYKDEGEGSQGYVIAVSRGTNLVVITVPIADISTDPIINTMISSVEITTPISDALKAGGVSSFAKYAIPLVTGWAITHTPQENSDSVTISKNHYQLTISQGAFGGAVCSFPDNPVYPNGMVQTFASFVKIDGQNNVLYRRGKITIAEEGGEPGTEKYEVCSWNAKNGMYQELTPFGRIDYTVPENPDATILSQMDSFVASLQAQN